MKRQFILSDPDPPAGGGGDPDPKKKDKPADPPTSAELGAGGKTAREIALEKKISTLEDEQHSLKGQLKSALEWIEQQSKAPAPSKEDLLDEVNSVLGWGVD
jgi:hypothetical protein